MATAFPCKECFEHSFTGGIFYRVPQAQLHRRDIIQAIAGGSLGVCSSFQLHNSLYCEQTRTV